MLGMSLGGMLEMQASQEAKIGGPGWAKAKSIIMIYLQGGPSHASMSLWDPKENDHLRTSGSILTAASPPRLLVSIWYAEL